MIKELFDKVLQLTDGEIITLTFKTFNDMNSKRVMLQRERRKYIEHTGGKRQDVFIHKEVDQKKGVFKLHLSSSGSLLDWMDNIVITKPSGEMMKLDVRPNDDVMARYAEMKGESNGTGTDVGKVSGYERGAEGTAEKSGDEGSEGAEEEGKS